MLLAKQSTGTLELEGYVCRDALGLRAEARGFSPLWVGSSQSPSLTLPVTNSLKASENYLYATFSA